MSSNHANINCFQLEDSVRLKRFRVPGRLALKLKELGISVAAVLRKAGLPRDLFCWRHSLKSGLRQIEEEDSFIELVRRAIQDRLTGQPPPQWMRSPTGCT